MAESTNKTAKTADELDAFVNKLRTATEDYKKMQGEVNQAKTLVEQLRQEYDKIPDNFLNSPEKSAKKAQLEAFTNKLRDYFGGSDENSLWSKNKVQQMKDLEGELGTTLDKVDISEWEKKAKDQRAAEDASKAAKDARANEAYVEYTYKPGDTFGQVLKDLGLGEGNLWGENGTVKYYTDQLWAEHPEVFDARGNIKVGDTIRLRKRGYEDVADKPMTAGEDPAPATNEEKGESSFTQSLRMAQEVNDALKNASKKETSDEGQVDSFTRAMRLAQLTTDFAKSMGKDHPDYVEYTYKPGDTFGQVIKDLGLGENNLWGENGTVKYYTDQLWAEHPEVFDRNGNIKVGTTIKLRKRNPIKYDVNVLNALLKEMGLRK